MMRRILLALAVAMLFCPTAGAQRGKPKPKEDPKPAKPTKPVKPADTPAPEPPTPAAKPGGDAARRESRIEFDERMVQGQTAAGAIYLFQRADAAFSSMIAPPQSFRERTVRTVYVDGVPGAGARP